MDIIFAKTAFITMFVAIDPPGLAAIFMTLTSHMNAADRKLTAKRSVMIAFSILTGASIIGRPTLGMLGISIPAFKIAGGLLLFYIAFEMVFARREQRKSQAAEDIVHDHPRDVAAFPLAIPMMSGPGAITASILQSDAARGEWINMLVLIAILGIVILSCLMVFLMAEKIDRFLGNTGRIVLSRMLGLLLAAGAVQSVGAGILAFAK